MLIDKAGFSFVLVTWGHRVSVNKGSYSTLIFIKNISHTRFESFMAVRV
jgi:hypothetical protein